MHDDAVFGACLAEVRRRMPRDPAEGIFGPDSALWRVAGLAFLPASGMRAVLLQIAHPAVAAAGVQHSRVREEFVQRSLRTFTTVWRMIYADQDAAFRAAHHVHRLHSHVRGAVPPEASAARAGTPYRALDPALLQWVLATMVDNCVHGHALFDRPLSPRDAHAVYRDMQTLGLLFGIPLDVWPAGMLGFEAWFERMLAEGLEVGPVARELAEFLFTDGWGGGPISRIWVAGLLPERIRDAYGLPWQRRHQAAFAGMLQAARTAWRLVPPPARRVPPEHLARWRVRRARAVDLWERTAAA